MKKVFFIISLIYSVACAAQINTNLLMSNMPPATMIDWEVKKETITFVIINQTGAVLRVLVKAELKTSDGAIVATTDLSRAEVMTVGPAGLVLSAKDVVPLDVMVFNGRFRTSLEKTGKLPSGGYELCVQLVTPADFRPASAVRCRSFTIAGFQLPIPTMPVHEQLIDLENARTTITFRWTPVVPRPNAPVRYRLIVFEILEKQTPMQALRSNQPLLTTDIVGTTQYIWQHQLPFGFLPAHENINESRVDSTYIINGRNAYGFIWTLQTFDQLGRPFGDGNINGDGVSEPNIFFIDRRREPLNRTKTPARIIYNIQ